MTHIINIIPASYALELRKNSLEIVKAIADIMDDKKVDFVINGHWSFDISNFPVELQAKLEDMTITMRKDIRECVIGIFAQSNWAITPQVNEFGYRIEPLGTITLPM